MKSDIKENVNNNTTKYPCLKQVVNEWGMCVILFTENSEGIVVYTSTENWSIGEHHDTWDEDEFTSFDGTITLAND